MVENDIQEKYKKLEEELQELKNKYSERSFKIMALNQLTQTIALEKDLNTLKYVICDMFFEVNLVQKAFAFSITDKKLEILNKKGINIENNNVKLNYNEKFLEELVKQRVISINIAKQRGFLSEITESFYKGYIISFKLIKGEEIEYFIIIIGEKSLGDYTDVDTEFLTTVSGQISIILENSSYTYQMEEKNKELSKTNFNLTVLNYASTLLNNTLDLNELINYVIDIFFEIYKAKKFIIFNFDEDKSEFKLHSSNGYVFLNDNKTFYINENLKYRILSSANIKNYKELKNSEIIEGLEKIIELNENTYLIPFVNKQLIVGAAIIESEEKIDTDFYNTLKLQITTALNNSKLYHSAITDGLTNLYNHIFFERQLKLEMYKHVKTSLLLIDVDNFKRFNDTYGHVAGDKALKTLAQTIKAYIRKQDIAARYGGEEFVVLFPDTELEEAYEIAEIIRKGVEDVIIEYEGAKLKITISMGVGEYNKSMNIDMYKFVSNVDSALYKSKRNGKNMVTKYIKDIE
ncbi:diguanylate cyclase (GGDEF)-like protein [Hypnocyclicus thermotrophus]|uniref:Diguanylate cyclase (GGDEF)-like protein n=1 Tax=Hypnocyclicus thermotrophus TaxID=1627895 RepID=A0AA46I5Z4_9FUSO|nr:GGDEF domain-containing protein [Hypnocyclicus thermotrophus]TDT71490.1 diguanylate cyclase (GGDEF)-like protein [Hypnocyclicus thermotrophus]